MAAMKRRCFVIMPFSKTTDEHTEEYWEKFYSDFISPALEECKYKAYKSVAVVNNITKNIVRELAMADLVLAVLTDNNRNVFYELGVRHSLRQGTIMVLEGDDRPFDISNYGILKYSRNDREKFVQDLRRFIDACESSGEDSPVADFLNQRITVSVNLAVGRLRQCAELIRKCPAADWRAALDEIRELQSNWHSEKEQVAVVDLKTDRFELHPDPSIQGGPVEDCWKDETFRGDDQSPKSLYPVMKDQRAGFRIAQIKDRPNRLTAIAFETIDSPSFSLLVVAEAHYYQEKRPY
jgi:hypothetical protein